ncbi:hypothetical protein GXP67_31025 [Rhodocytophaga rosea]|uniref:Lipoprotein n=1 Tax=Rhodocytophaga rosea TaxID=2704465 RepID=A0A6C0GRR8_9BACT|nr:hypothetical protein [Rhodocytophaga rosea]QHT70768.1 hypothetical protein GXP67_31025 [Rhodocytophaga rosea]
MKNTLIYIHFIVLTGILFSCSEAKESTKETSQDTAKKQEEALGMVELTQEQIQSAAIVTGFLQKRNLGKQESKFALPNEAFVQSAGDEYVFVPKGTRQEGNQVMYDYQMIHVYKEVSDSGYTHVILPDSLNRYDTKFVIKGADLLLSKMINKKQQGHGH